VYGKFTAITSWAQVVAFSQPLKTWEGGLKGIRLIALTIFIAAIASPECYAEVLDQACAPKPGEGARWLIPCENAAKTGDSGAAIIVGEIFWNGDGVPKDNASAARWWRMADQGGQPQAPMLLGNEAYVRGVPGGGVVNLPALDEAVNWFQKALKVEPDPVARQQAQQRLDEIAHLHKLMPHT
jgi:hypothetical protein